MIAPLTTSGPARFASLTALMLLLPAADGTAAIPGDQLKALRDTPGTVSAASPVGRTSESIHDEMIDDMVDAQQDMTEELSISVAEELNEDMTHSVSDDIDQEVDSMSQADTEKLNTRLLRILKDNTVGAGQDG